jgi:signal transduction histidine kinase
MYAQPAGGPIETVVLEEVVRTALQGFSREFERRGVTLELELDAAAAGVHGNRALLAEVLNNLISNAFDAMPQGGRLRLTARGLDPHRVEIAIADTGVGIPPERLRHVFTPFFTTKGRGMGLGLPLSQRILRRCGGDITLDSTPGTGATVRLQLQIAN